MRAEDGQVVGTVLVFKDVTDTQEQRRLLAYSANHDVLTGLPNRAAFAVALAEARKRAFGGQQNALCFIDLDRFKPVNDGAGHAAGDALLHQVAETIRKSCRSHDLAARLGGDEFVLLLTDCSVADAQRVAQTVVHAIASIHFSWDGTTYRIGASVGIAPVGGGEEPLVAADRACYEAKALGRGQVVVAMSEVH